MKRLSSHAVFPALTVISISIGIVLINSGLNHTVVIAGCIALGLARCGRHNVGCTRDTVVANRVAALVAHLVTRYRLRRRRLAPG